MFSDEVMAASNWVPLLYTPMSFARVPGQGDSQRPKQEYQRAQKKLQTYMFNVQKSRNVVNYIFYPTIFFAFLKTPELFLVQSFFLLFLYLNSAALNCMNTNVKVYMLIIRKNNKVVKRPMEEEG